jgi:hypothetical protein
MISLTGGNNFGQGQQFGTDFQVVSINNIGIESETHFITFNKKLGGAALLDEIFGLAYAQHVRIGKQA